MRGVSEDTDRQASFPQTARNNFQEVPCAEESEFGLLGDPELLRTRPNAARRAEGPGHAQSKLGERPRRLTIVQSEFRPDFFSFPASVWRAILHATLHDRRGELVPRKYEPAVAAQPFLAAQQRSPPSDRPCEHEQQRGQANLQFQSGARPAVSHSPVSASAF